MKLNNMTPEQKSLIDEKLRSIHQDELMMIDELDSISINLKDLHASIVGLKIRMRNNITNKELLQYALDENTLTMDVEAIIE